MLTEREQRQRDIDACYNARMARLQWLNAAENEERRSNAALRAFGRLTLTREAAERAARMAAFAERQRQRAAQKEAQRAAVAELFKLLADRRQRRSADAPEGWYVSGARR